jgi:hypothetical protein
MADRWNKWFVRVKFDHEPRSAQGMTWVKPHDVRRSDPAGTEPANPGSPRSEAARHGA